MRSPLDLVSVARFAGLLCLLSVAAQLVSRTIGRVGVNAFAAVAGFADVDAVTLSIGPLVAKGLSSPDAATAVALALAANQALKIAAAALVGNCAFALRFAVMIGAATGAGAVAGIFSLLI